MFHPLQDFRTLSCSLTLVALAWLPGCALEDTQDLEPAEQVAQSEDTPRAIGLACVAYCEAREGQLRSRCEQEDNTPEVCDALVTTHTSVCIERQCGLHVELPEPPDLEELARQIATGVLGHEYDLVNVIPRHWDEESIGSRAYIFESGIDGARAFVEMGASLEQPPIVSYGFGEIGDVGGHERAMELLSQYYGEDEYEHGRTFFTAAHGVLEYTSPAGSFYYSVARDEVSDEFAIFPDPEADLELLSIRREANKAEWDRYLSGNFE